MRVLRLPFRRRLAGAGMGRFLALCAGQGVSQVGSGMTLFALGVWVYERTGSATSFALTLLTATVPQLAVLPLAGALADRWDRRRLILGSEALAALLTLALAALLHAGRLQVWHTYLAVAARSVLSAFQGPAVVAATAMLVPRGQLARARGISQGASSIAVIAAPALTGVLLPWIGMAGIVMADFATCFAPLFALLRVRLPAAAPAGPLPPVWRSLAEGARTLAGEADLRWIAGYTSVLVLGAAVLRVLVRPMVLSFGTAATLGWVVSAGVAGALAGAALVGAWGGRSRRATAALAGGLLIGVGMTVAALRPLAVVVGAGSFLVNFGLTVVDTCLGAVWQDATPQERHGRLAAAFRMLGGVVTVVGYAAAGPLADAVFTPLVAGRGALARAAGLLVGTGPGRGSALLLLLAGAVTAAFAAANWLSPRVRRLDEPAHPG